MRVELQSLPPSLFHPLRVLRCRHRRKGREGSRRKASAYKSRFVENKNHFGGRIARLRAIDGRSGARLVDLSTPSWKKKKKKGRKTRLIAVFRTDPISIEGSVDSIPLPPPPPPFRSRSPRHAPSFLLYFSFSLFFFTKVEAYRFLSSSFVTTLSYHFSSEFSSRFEGI